MNQNKYIIFRQSGIHGTGGFAAMDIPDDTHIIEYVGEKISKEESARRCESDNEFIFTITDEYDIDGNVEWNPARHINHSCSPNCDALDFEEHIWIVANRDIKAGEEITFNYGYDLENYEEHLCRCGAPDCIGYIIAEEYVEERKKLAAAVKEATQKPEVGPAPTSEPALPH